MVFPAKMPQVTRGKAVLPTKHEQDYCWMWTHKTAGAVALKASFWR